MREAGRRLAATLAAGALAAAGAGCGGDDGNGDGGSGAPAAPPGGDAAGVPLSGIEAPPPDEVAACLEQAGLTAGAGGAPGGEGVEDRLTVANQAGGEGTVTWYATEEEAIAGHQEENADLEPGSVIGRTGDAVYVFSGEDFDTTGGVIQRCL